MQTTRDGMDVGGGCVSFATFLFAQKRKVGMILCVKSQKCKGFKMLTFSAGKRWKKPLMDAEKRGTDAVLGVQIPF